MSDALAGLQSRLRAWLPLFRFALIGIVVTAIDFAVFFALVLGLDCLPAAAHVLGWLTAIQVSYVLNGLWTFRVPPEALLVARNYLRFVGGYIVGLVASTAALMLCSMATPIVVAKCLATVVAFAVNYTLSRLVFSRA